MQQSVSHKLLGIAPQPIIELIWQSVISLSDFHVMVPELITSHQSVKSCTDQTKTAVSFVN